MKALVFTDTHMSDSAYKSIKKKSKSADLLVCCGDFSLFGIEMKEGLARIASHRKEVFIILGNHEDGEEVDKLVRRHKNVRLIHGRLVKFLGITFVGWGGEGFTRKSAGFEAFAKKIKLEGPTVFVVHQPPYKTELDRLEEGYVGNKSFTDFIRKAKPDYVFCGHLHEKFRKKDKIGKTVVINPGPKGMLIEI